LGDKGTEWQCNFQGWVIKGIQDYHFVSRTGFLSWKFRLFISNFSSFNISIQCYKFSPSSSFVAFNTFWCCVLIFI
jgi:hypothetical protein